MIKKMNDKFIVTSSLSYSIVAEIRSQKVVYFNNFGDYQGEWLMLALDKENQMYHIYKDYYGSCSGCDWLENKSDSYERDEKTWNIILSQENVDEIKKEYPPFLSISKKIIDYFLENRETFVNWFTNLIPGNFSYEINGEIPTIASDIYTNIKEPLNEQTKQQ